MALKAKTVEVPLGAPQIMKILPHRYPFLLVDRVLELIPGKRAVGIKNVTINEPFFQGQEMLVMPGVLTLEALCQVAGILIHEFLPEAEREGKAGFVGGMDAVRFHRRVVPGDQLRLEVTLLKNKAGVFRVEATAKVDGEIACEATLTIALTSA